MSLTPSVLENTLYHAHNLLVGEDFGRPLYGGEPDVSLALGRLERAIKAGSANPEFLFIGEAELAAQRLAELIDEKLDPLTIAEAPVLDWFFRLVSLKDIEASWIKHFASLTSLSDQYTIAQHLLTRSGENEVSLRPTVQRELETILCQVITSSWGINVSSEIARLIYTKRFSPKGALIPFVLNYLSQNPDSPVSIHLSPSVAFSIALPEEARRQLWLKANKDNRASLWNNLFGREDLQTALRLELVEEALNPKGGKQSFYGMDHSFTDLKIKKIFSSAELPGLQGNLSLICRVIDHSTEFGTFARFKAAPDLHSPTLLAAWLVKTLQKPNQSATASQVLEILSIIVAKSVVLPKVVLSSLLNHTDKEVRIAAIAAAGITPKTKSLKRKV